MNEGNELSRQALELCWEVEKLPASPEQTEVAIKAGALHQRIEQLEQEWDQVIHRMKSLRAAP